MREQESTGPRKYYYRYWTPDTGQTMYGSGRHSTLEECLEIVEKLQVERGVTEYVIYYEKVTEVIVAESVILGSHFDLGTEPE